MVFGNNIASDISKFSKIPGAANGIWKILKETQASAFLTIVLRPNIQPRLSSFEFIFVSCFFGELL